MLMTSRWERFTKDEVELIQRAIKNLFWGAQAVGTADASPDEKETLLRLYKETKNELGTRS